MRHVWWAFNTLFLLVGIAGLLVLVAWIMFPNSVEKLVMDAIYSVFIGGG